VTRERYQPGREPSPPPGSGRARQRARTRRLILSAALALIRDGHVPTVEDAAAAADVSPATGYRYFASQAALLGAVVGALVPEEITEAIRGTTAQERIDDLLAAGFPHLVETEALDRAILHLALNQWIRERIGRATPETPITRPGRKPLVKEIIRPLRNDLDEPALKQLELGLGMVLGIESYVALSDIYDAKPEEILETWRFACKAMVQAAIAHGDRGS
jgi:AcrR family transcriptional regulator